MAIDGGAPVRTEPFAPWPSISPDEIAAASAILASGKVNYWTGDEGRHFEGEFAKSVSCKYAVAVANGSLALELALHSLGIGAGDEVIVPSRSFIASATCVSMCGAVPVFADAEPESGNLSAETVLPLITKKTKAVIAVHLGGWPCDMDPILKLAARHKLKVIEDCAQAQGAIYKGHPVGSLGHVAAFSFCQDKIMTTGGEGGMLVTNDKNVWRHAWSFKDHGKSYEAVYKRKHPPGFRWLHESIGSNWRMTEMQSALGRVMLPKVPGRIRQRQRNAALLHAAFSRMSALRTVQPGPKLGHACYRYYAYLRPERLVAGPKGWTRDRLVTALEAEGIPCFSGSCSEIYLEKSFPQSLRPPQRLPVARELGETSLAFLVHPTLSEQDMKDTIAAMEKIMQHAVAS